MDCAVFYSIDFCPVTSSKGSSIKAYPVLMKYQFVAFAHKNGDRLKNGNIFPNRTRFNGFTLSIRSDDIKAAFSDTGNSQNRSTIKMPRFLTKYDDVSGGIFSNLSSVSFRQVQGLK